MLKAIVDVSLSMILLTLTTYSRPLTKLMKTDLSKEVLILWRVMKNYGVTIVLMSHVIKNMDVLHPW